MMNLDEAIKHCEEKATALKDDTKNRCDIPDEDKEYCLECAKKYEQLAEWLKELKELRGDCEYENGKLLKRMSGGYVTYKVEYLLDHLAREVSLLESYRKWKEDKENNK